MISCTNDFMVVFSERVKARRIARPYCGPYLPLRKTNLNTNNVILSTKQTKTELNSVALVRTRTIPTERPPPVSEVSANFCG